MMGEYDLYNPSVNNSQDSLSHYGRLGMKWYQHIYGEYQGAAKYAEKGKKLRSKMTSKLNSAFANRRHEQYAKLRKKAQNLEEKIKDVEAVRDRANTKKQNIINELESTKIEKGVKVKSQSTVNDNGDIIFKKGSTFNRVTTDPNEKGERATYLYTDADKEVYEGAFSKYLSLSQPGKQIFKQKYEAKEDLISPSEEKRVDEFIKMYRDNVIPDLGEKLSNRAAILEDFGYEQTSRPGWEYGVDFNDKTSDKTLRTTGYITFNSLVEGDKKSLETYMNRLKKQGYNALIDDNNREIYNKAAEPIIAMYGDKSVEKLGVPTKISSEEIESNVANLRAKNGKVLL